MKHKPLLPALLGMILAASLLAGCAGSPAASAIPSETPAPAQGNLATDNYPFESNSASPTASATGGDTASQTYPAQAPTQAGGAFAVIDALGRSVSFETLPLNIVVVGKATSLINNTLFLFPEAVERVSAYEARLQTNLDFITVAFDPTGAKSSLARDAGAEQVAPLNPDLVIMKTYMREKVGQPIEALGIPVVYLDLETPVTFYEDLRVIGAIFGNPARAEELISLYQANQTRIQTALEGLKADELPSALILQYSAKDGEVAFKVPPASWLQTSMTETAGGSPLWKEIPDSGGWTTVTLEQIAAWDPQFVFIVEYGGSAPQVVEALQADPTWQSLRAVKDGHLYAFPLDFLSWDQADPRWGLGELWLAAKLHPERFAELDFNNEIIAFYRDYYGLDEAFIRESILPLVQGSF